jgi:hypothetical protein
LIQEGIVEIDIKLGFSQTEDPANVFIIERLSKGAIINPKTFLPEMSDECDTDYKCRTQVEAWFLKTSVIMNLA